ncbi:MAG: hypothetical protein ACLTWE_08220 [Dysgonomonas mossii]|uniref:hypothetical protein n=1 Tax=Dysgonomonas mossii TaxID=163665 RepID=UPI003993F02E
MRIKKNKHPVKQEKKPSTKIVIISIFIGLSLGVLYWYCISRCDDEHCYQYYVPTGELLVFGLAGWVFPYIFQNDKNKKK